jgi:uncharacterized membrane protein YdfJ with MMPL/SSD domain
MERLARFIDRRPGRTIAVAIAFFALAGAFGAGVAKRLDPFGADDPASESVVADKRLQHAGFRETGVVVLIKGVDVRSGPGRERVERLTRRVAAEPTVAATANALTNGPDFVSKDGESTYIAVGLRPTSDRARQDAAEELARTLGDERGVIVGGPALAERQANTQVEHDLRTAELYAFPVLLVLSLLFFRSLVAALLPLLVGGLAIVGTLFVLRLASGVTSISIFALNVATGLGLGLAIDYSLFVVSRYREELARSGPGFEAMRRTLATAGRTVLFSSLTVAGALVSLLVFPQRFLYSMGVAGFFVSLLAAAIALTVLPAVLTLLGPRVNAFAPAGFLARRAERDSRPAREGFWYRLAQLVMRFPGRSAALAAGLLVALALPVLSIHFTAVDAQVLPHSASARQVDDALRTEFPPYRDSPITLAVDGRPAAARHAAEAAGGLRGVAAVRPPRSLGDGTYQLDVISESAPLSSESRQLVRELRDRPDTLVTGSTAHFLDLHESLGAHLPYALAIVAVLTFAVLFAMTGSVVLPIKQLVMNTLVLGAMFGLLVLGFQHGGLEGPLGFTSQGGLEAPQLLLLFAVVFGLSTDYGVFLLSRIKEARDEGRPDAEAIAVGLERTGRIVTSAALLFAVAFGAFLTSQIVITKELGLGTAAAVLLDATIVRALLVPALMRLLGRWNWWAPSPLRRLHARLQLGET